MSPSISVYRLTPADARCASTTADAADAEERETHTADHHLRLIGIRAKSAEVVRLTFRDVPTHLYETFWTRQFVVRNESRISPRRAGSMSSASMAPARTPLPAARIRDIGFGRAVLQLQHLSLTVHEDVGLHGGSKSSPATAASSVHRPNASKAGEVEHRVGGPTEAGNARTGQPVSDDLEQSNHRKCRCT